MNEIPKNMEVLAQETDVICQNFTAFCTYVLDNHVKLAKNTSNIGKKDCFALNALFHVKEEYEKPTRLQSDYPVICFFYYVAVKYGILRINHAGTTFQEGKNYSCFLDASTWEQYILFLTVFLFDGKFAETGHRSRHRMADPWNYYIDGFMDWYSEAKPCTGSRVRLSDFSQIRIFSELDMVIPYLEMLNLIRVWNRPDINDSRNGYWWGIEVLPLMEVVSDIYENLDMYEDTDMDEEEIAVDRVTWVQYVYEVCMNRFLPNQRDNGVIGIFNKNVTENPEQIIDLEVTVRHTDCVRVLRMNLSDTLYELHRMIQKAVSFDDDHLYEFTVGSGMMKEVYVSPDVMTSGNEPLVTAVSLTDLDLRKRQQFSYLFDYGEMWWFDIKVLEIHEGVIDKPAVIKEINEAPIQYPDYEW